MKSIVQKLIILCLIAQVTFAQEVTSFVTKIERGVDVGNLEDYFNAGLAPFYHGVASGDPLEDAVIIWTRVTTNQNNVDVKYKVATDPAMTRVVKQGTVTTNQSKDYTVKVDVTGLNPFTTYYYQFEVKGVSSIVGKTRTAPSSEMLVENLRFAVVSCSNYQAGYFNTYNQIAERTDIDAVIHLGDYIYEYESGGYGFTEELGRGHIPSEETIQLNDYRTRYSFYRLDPMLRNVHSQHPFIHIWDDHEFANDANKFGAQNHTPGTEGDWETRKNNAYKAYFEWMPVRANTIEEYRLYRSISYGKLMDLIMLDTRIEGRETQINTSKNLISAVATNGVLRNYLKKQIASKDLTNKADLTQVLQDILPRVLTISEDTTQKGLNAKEFDQLVSYFADAVLSKNKSIADSKNASEMEQLLQKGITYDNEYNEKDNKNTYTSILGAEQFDWLLDELSSSSAKWRVIGNQVMMMPWNGIPSQDAWDGYKEERNRLLEHIKSENINNVVVLTGDIHSTFVGEVRYERKCEMCEFVVPSVTSLNLDFVGSIAAGIGEFYIKLLNRHIKDVDLDNHGYYLLDVREDKVQADWFDVLELDKPQPGESRSRSWYVNNNDCRVRKASRATQAIANRTEETLSMIQSQKPMVTDDVIVLGVYPNPLATQGNVQYVVNSTTNVTVALYDMQGRLVQELQNQVVEPGIYNVSFTVNNLKGQYVVALKSNTTEVNRKVIIK